MNRVTNTFSLRALVIALCAIVSSTRFGAAASAVNDYTVTWDTQEWDPQEGLIPPAYGSMPTGNGDLGANVWCLHDTLHAMICKNDSWLDWCDESLDWYFNGERKTECNGFGKFNLVKLGVLDISLSPNPFRDGTFSQTLNLEESFIEVSGGTGQERTTIRIWADANASVLNVEASSQTPFTMAVTVEGTETHGNELMWVKRDDGSMVDYFVELAEQQGVSTSRPNPVENLTSGWIMRGEGFTASGNSLQTATAATSARLRLHPLVAQTATDEEWLTEVRARAEATDEVPAADAFGAHKQWWSGFWDRSHVFVEGDADADTITQIYLLQRYMNGCSGRGRYPIKFNGGLFLIHDSRRWGPPFWIQNTRHIYWPMLPAGDFDLMEPWFGMIRDVMPVQKEVTAFRFPGTRGLYLPETMYHFGMHRLRDYRTKNGFIWEHFNGTLEVLAVMAERYWYTLDEDFLSRVLIPFADEALKFFDTNFPRKDGRLFLESVSALETYWDINNPSCDIAGLKRCLDLLLALPEGACPDSLQARWTRFQEEIPEIPIVDGAVAPYESGESDVHNSEHPAVYAVWPFRQYGVGLPDIEIAQKTLAQNSMGKRRATQRTHNGGWNYRTIETAYAGMTDKMAERLTWNFEPQVMPHPFGEPYFRFVGYDWSIDGDLEQCGNNAGTTALYASIVQEAAGKFHVLPAWPPRWDVTFKLHQFYRTVMEGAYDADTKKLELTVHSAKELSPEDIVLHNGVTFAEGSPVIARDTGVTIMSVSRRPQAGSLRIEACRRGVTIHTGTGPVTADIFDAVGKQVCRISGFGPAVAWNGTTTRGTSLGAGCYVVRVKSPGLRRTASVFLGGR